MDGVSNFNTFLLLHKHQLCISGIPERFWPIVCKKLQDEIFDAGLTFQLAEIDYEDVEIKCYDPLWSVVALTDIDYKDPTHIYLIDHAWTFKANNVRDSLLNIPGLLERMCAMMKIPGDINGRKKIEKVVENVWKYAHTYSLIGDQLDDEARVTHWYVLDELGSGITHSNTPNFRAVPFIHLPQQMTYTLLFPIKNVEKGTIITKNMVEEINDILQREAMLVPWKHFDYFENDFLQKEPDNQYFLEGHVVETLPQVEVLTNRAQTLEKLKVYSDYSQIRSYLTGPEFEIVELEDDADVLWYIDHFKSYQDLSEQSPEKFVNQFPFEYVITNKDLLAIMARRTTPNQIKCPGGLETLPLWLPTTFNLKTELSQFVCYYLRRKLAGLDNNWICKPFNLARSLDTYITDNLNFICRLPVTGPKIAQKYIEDPVLFDRPDKGLVKFDLRYVIILKSVMPTETYVYKNFFLRFANKAFGLNNFDDYEQHFTVMNYAEGINLYKLLCAQFKEEWSKQYVNYDWDRVEKSIMDMLAELFTGATLRPPPFGIAKNPQSRALYAADIMLSWHKDGDNVNIQPKLLEINWMPDCERACQYYPNFFNDVFKVMFLDKEVDTFQRVL